VLEQSSKSLEIKLDLAHLDTKLVDELHEMLAMHPGKKRVKLHVVDVQEQLDIKLPVKEFKVDISKELLSSIEAHEALHPHILS
jgi:hypothetical protein